MNQRSTLDDQSLLSAVYFRKSALLPYSRLLGRSHYPIFVLATRILKDISATFKTVDEYREIVMR